MEAELVHLGDGRERALICVVNSPEHPIELEGLCHGLHSSVASAFVGNWGKNLAPWSAPALYRQEQPFGDGARITTKRLRHDALPSLEREHGLVPTRHAILGYSLAGLFALYAFLEDGSFDAAASVSGSLWYDGWLDYVLSRQVVRADERFAYLSVGTKEKRAARPQLKEVERRTLATKELLQSKGITTKLQLGPGGHLQHVLERVRLALEAVDGFLT